MLLKLSWIVFRLGLAHKFEDNCDPWDKVSVFEIFIRCVLDFTEKFLDILGTIFLFFNFVNKTHNFLFKLGLKFPERYS